jgi:tRNA pseudouridine55 synthase
MAELAGILNIDKPLGLTSHDVVSGVRRLAGIRRVGHGGTLDPLATGVLVVALGFATRLLEYVTDQPKSYEAVVRLGQTSTTYDAEGELSPAHDLPGLVTRLSPPLLDEALEQFRGPIEQVPPMYSAVKQEGRPLYELARRGLEVTRKPRPVTVYELALVAWAPPDLHFRVRCSAGTYVRSLAHDLGQVLGTGGYLFALRRSAVGPFRLASAVPLDVLSAENLAANLLAPDSAVAHLPRLTLDGEAAGRLRHGQRLPREHADDGGELARAYAPGGDFVGIVAASGAYWRPRKIFTRTDKNYG